MIYRTFWDKSSRPSLSVQNTLHHCLPMGKKKKKLSQLHRIGTFMDKITHNYYVHQWIMYLSGIQVFTINLLSNVIKWSFYLSVNVVGWIKISMFSSWLLCFLVKIIQISGDETWCNLPPQLKSLDGWTFTVLQTHSVTISLVSKPVHYRMYLMTFLYPDSVAWIMNTVFLNRRFSPC